MTASTARATTTVKRAATTTSGHARWSLLLIAVVAVTVTLPAWLMTRAPARVATQLEFTGAPWDYVVPAGVCLLRIELVGAAGGQGGSAGAPGAGARASAGVEVTPGETLRVRVGGWGGEAVGATPGAGGWNGGGRGGSAIGPGRAGSGGGGATEVRQGGDGLEHRIIVAAGGSGGAGAGSEAQSVPVAVAAA